MLSNLSRLLTYLTGLLYTILGFLLFFLPEQFAPAFAWKVTPFMTMTIGGWCIGNAWLAWITARRWQWSVVYSALLYLWLFGVGELLVLFNFRDKLVLAHPIAWLYLLTLVVNAITAVVGFIDWIRIRPKLASSNREFSTAQSTATIAFVLFVGFLGLYGSNAQIGVPGTNGGIFPEVLGRTKFARRKRVYRRARVKRTRPPTPKPGPSIAVRPTSATSPPTWPSRSSSVSETSRAG